MAKKYDYIIVGAGLFGATCARLLTDAGKKCLVIERASAVGGMCTTKKVHDIMIHLFAPHIFHTNNDRVWQFINKFGNFVPSNYHVISLINNKITHLPVSMSTFYDVFGTCLPTEASKNVQKEITMFGSKKPETFEEYCINLYGTTIYGGLIKPYYEKLYNKNLKEIPVEIAQELSVRYLYNDTYYMDYKYEGIPVDGYTALIENMLGNDIDVLLNKDFLANKDQYCALGTDALIVIYTGAIDSFCNYIYGALDWGCTNVDIKNEKETAKNIFGATVIQKPQDNDLIELIEHKWLTPNTDTEEFVNNNIISYVYKDTWDPSKYTMFPLRTNESMMKYHKYKSFVEERFKNILFVGRNAMYTPLNMSQTIEFAMGVCSKLIETIK